MSWVNPFDVNATPTSYGEVTWGDHLSSIFNVGGSALVGAVPAAVRYGAEATDTELGESIAGASQYLQGKIADWGEGAVERMSPAARQRLLAEVGSEEFLSHPFSSLALKAGATLPSVAASVAATVFTGGGAAALVALAGTGGVISAGQALDDINQSMDSQSDADLRKASTLYAGYRSMGLSEQEARNKLSDVMTGVKPVLLFGLGAITSLIGPAGQFSKLLGVKGIGELASGSITRRVATEAGKGAGAETVQTAAEMYTTEQAAVDAALKPGVDVGRVVSAGIEGGLIGGLFGGVAGVGGKRSNTSSMPIRAGDTGATPAIVPESPAAPPAAVTAPATPTQYPKAEAAKAAGRKKVVLVPDAITPNPEMAVAMAPPVAAQPSGAPAAPAPAPEAPLVPPSQIPPPPPAPVPAQLATPLQQNAGPTQVTGPTPTAAPTTPPAQTLEAPIDGNAPVPVPGLGKGTVAVREGAPRVLPDLTVKPEARAEIAKAEKAKGVEVLENIKAVHKEELGPQGKKRSKAEIEERDKSASTAKSLFEELVPVEDKIPTDTAGRNALKARLDGILARATEAGIKIPARVGYEGTDDHIVWLREVKDLAGRMGKKNFLGAKAREHITSFLIRERAAKSGDFSVMRSERAAEGELASRAQQKDVDTIAAPVNQPAASEAEEATDTSELQTAPEEDDGKGDVATKVTSSKRGSVRDQRTESMPEAPNASEGRKVTITDELKAKALAALELAQHRAEARGTDQPTVTPKVTPKVAAIKENVEKRSEPSKIDAKTVPVVKTVGERIKEAANKVDRKPTEAQKEAGNFQKGHPSVQGVPLTLENAKGSTRTGKTEDGKTWSVDMPAHYGYIKGTEGADGDQIDMFLGPNPNSDLVVVIDQVDPDTRAFDEHKVLIGFNSIRAAQDTYDAAFDDGRGMERVGDFRVMTVAELKEWLKGDTTKPAGEVVDNLATVEPTNNSSGGFIRRSRYQYDLSAEILTNVLQATAIKTGSFEEFMPHANSVLDNLENLSTYPKDKIKFIRATLPLFISRIKAVAGNVPTYIIPDADFDDIFDKDSAAIYNHAADNISIRESITLDPDFPQILLHEGVHAAFIRTTHLSPDVVNVVDAIAREARQAMVDWEYANPTDIYAFTNIDEFIAEAFSNPAWRALVSS